MTMERELNSRLFLQREECIGHVEYSHEYQFYDNIARGDIEAVKKDLVNPEDVSRYESEEYGKLSKDYLRNICYHFVISVAMITRACVEKGLERELAYTLSDLYIGRMDMLRQANEIGELYNEMLMDFAKKMAMLPKQKVYSVQIVKALEYIYMHRNERLTVSQIAEELSINRSYLSMLFRKETGSSISDFIRREKVKAAQNMLRFSEYSYGDVAEYFGFASQSHFIKCFKEQTGMTPKEYRSEQMRSARIE